MHVASAIGRSLEGSFLEIGTMEEWRQISGTMDFDHSALIILQRMTSDEVERCLRIEYDIQSVPGVVFVLEWSEEFNFSKVKGCSNQWSEQGIGS